MRDGSAQNSRRDRRASSDASGGESDVRMRRWMDCRNTSSWILREDFRDLNRVKTERRSRDRVVRSEVVERRRRYLRGGGGGGG
jgi:hypothetical protein